MKSIYDKRFISEAKAQAAAEKAGCTEVIKDGKMWRVKTPAEIAPAQSDMDGSSLNIEPSDQPSDAQRARAETIEYLHGLIAAAKTAEAIQQCYDTLNAANLGEPLTSELDEEIGLKAQQIEAEAQMTSEQVKHAPGNKPGWVHASSVLKPTKLVWAIADEMYAAAEAAGKPLPSRKEVQDECVRRGIASGTARTQFQHWFKQRNESAAAPRATIGPDGKIIPAK